MEPNCKPDHEALHARLHEQIKKLFNVEDTSGIEMMMTLQRVAYLSEVLESQLSGEVELSGPRMRLMVRLLMEEQMGNQEGISPTSLSHYQRVSKNTISSLLRGLEEQGLIRRNLDSQDLRVFRIQLTDAGRELILRTAPGRVAGLNQILSGLTKDEAMQLKALLEKLQRTLMAHLHTPEKAGGIPVPAPVETAEILQK
jgi:DNA-binding MarR family transcriptional regulator